MYVFLFFLLEDYVEKSGSLAYLLYIKGLLIIFVIYLCCHKWGDKKKKRESLPRWHQLMGAKLKDMHKRSSNKINSCHVTKSISFSVKTSIA